MIDIDEIREKLLEKENEEIHYNGTDIHLVYSFLCNCRQVILSSFTTENFLESEMNELLIDIQEELNLLLKQNRMEDCEEKISFFLSELPKAKKLLFGTVKALAEGDPASGSYQEIALCYPGVYAIASYRIANILYRMGLKFIARAIAEEAHSKTGIDINPGATIGKNFFIDHGTGIVIGETAVIGNDVKLYQGVTLGALSLAKGRQLKHSKRHPTVGNHVTIYSNASIFGGETLIGDHCTIGANVYLTQSVEENTIVYLGEHGITSQKKAKKSEE